LAGATFVNRLGTMVEQLLVLYLTRSLGIEAEVAGALLAVYGLASLAAAALGGWLTDRFGAQPVLVASLVLSGPVMAVYPWMRSLPALVATTAALSLISGIFRPASMTLVAQLAPPEQTTRAFALHRLAVNLGFAFGPAIGGLLAGIYFPAIFWADGATAVVAGLLLAFGLSRAAGRPETTAEDVGAVAGTSAYRHGRFLLLMLCVLGTGLVFFQIDASLPLFMVRELGLAETSFGLLFTINTAIIIVLEVPLNAALERWPIRRTLSLGALLVALGMSASGLASGFGSLVLTVVVWTFGEMILFPVCSAYVSELAPDGRSGQYMGVYTMVFGIAATVAPWGGVVVYERHGAALWPLMLVVGLVAAAGMAAVAHRRRPGAVTR
jgi:MFS family permease